MSNMKCFKCNAAQAIIATREGKKCYCAGCHTDFVNRTTRDALFRHCFVPIDTPVVIAVSGGLSSMALAHVLGILRQTNLQRGGNGKINFDFHILFVDEDGLVPNGDEAGEERAMLGQKAASTTPSLLRWALVEASILRWTHNNVACYDASRIHRVRAIDVLDSEQLSTLRTVLREPKMTLTDRISFYNAFMASLLVRVTQSLTLGTPGSDGTATDVRECTHIIVGDSAVRSATKALTAVVLGRGEHIVADSAHRGQLHGCFFLRPFINLLPKEIFFYARLHGVQWNEGGSALPAPLRRVPCLHVRRTVQSLLESFLMTLMVTFRSTVFNVLTSVAKMKVDGAPLGSSMTTGRSTPQGGSAPGTPRGSSPVGQPQQRFVLSRESIDHLRRAADGAGRNVIEGGGEDFGGQSRGNVCRLCGMVVRCSSPAQQVDGSGENMDDSSHSMCLPCKLLSKAISQHLPKLPDLSVEDLFRVDEETEKI